MSKSIKGLGLAQKEVLCWIEVSWVLSQVIEKGQKAQFHVSVCVFFSFVYKAFYAWRQCCSFGNSEAKCLG